jgi:hypothetical protein
MEGGEAVATMVWLLPFGYMQPLGQGQIRFDFPAK